MKLFLIIFFFLGLVYLLWPGPENVSDFKQLPKSLKSDEPGDSIEHPQRVAFFSDYYRDFVMDYYENEYKNISFLPFKPLRINYPPEFAYTFVKDQILATYLEELVYPMKNSLYINGFEPFYKNDSPKYYGATTIVVNNNVFATKTTLRFYPSSVLIRIITWLGVTISLYFLIILGRKTINE